MNSQPGWHPQPDGTQRYWDGQQWTQDIAPGQSWPPPQNQRPTKQPPQSGPQRKRNFFTRHPVLSLTILVLAGIIFAFIVKPGDKSDSTTSTSNSPVGPGAAKPADAAGMNSAVKDGKFEFTVTGMMCGIPSIGQDSLQKTPQGEFCRADVVVKNIGNEAQMLDASSQEAMDAAGKKYKADSGVMTGVPEMENMFLKQINPGNQVNGAVVFDVPKGTQLTQLVLHDSMFSQGGKIKLTPSR